MVINDRLKYQIVYLVIMMISLETLKGLESFTSSKSRMRLEKSKIHRLFTSMRPAYSNAEEEFVQKYMLSPNLLSLGMYQDGYGNCLLKIDNEDGTPSKTLWSCHTDSVHNRGGFQTVHFNPLEDKFSTTDGSCLGGDDNSGTYAMLEMIRNKVPGLYIFHRAEEVGGRGSAWIVDNNEEMLKNYDRAIAFDRKDIHSIFVPSEEFSSGGYWRTGIIPIPNIKNDFIFIVTYGQSQGEHKFDEGINENGIFSWQSQPKKNSTFKRREIHSTYE